MLNILLCLSSYLKGCTCAARHHQSFLRNAIVDQLLIRITSILFDPRVRLLIALLTMIFVDCTLVRRRPISTSQYALNNNNNKKSDQYKKYIPSCLYLIPDFLLKVVFFITFLLYLEIKWVVTNCQ